MHLISARPKVRVLPSLEGSVGRGSFGGMVDTVDSKSTSARSIGSSPIANKWKRKKRNGKNVRYF